MTAHGILMRRSHARYRTCDPRSCSVASALAWQSDDASEAMRGARKQLNDAREAHAEQQRTYEDCKNQRVTMAKEKKAGKEREKAFEEGEKAAKLDGQGELDADGELMLKQKSNDVQAAHVSIQLERESAQTQVSHIEEVFQRLRRATHDPESISTPQDLIMTMLSAKERGEDLEAQRDKTDQLQQQLVQDKQRLETELQTFMYYGTSQLNDAAEREFEPQLEQANKVMEYRRKKCTAAKGLVHESKIGIALLTHLTSGDSIEKLVGDSDIPMALDRIERHLLSCLATINHGGSHGAHVPRSSARTSMAAKAAAVEAKEAVVVDDVTEAAAGGAEGDLDGGEEEKPAESVQDVSGEGRANAPLAPHPPAYPKPTNSGRPDGATSNNIRVLTQEELEHEIDNQPDAVQEGYDDEGNELSLTRRVQKGTAKDKKGGRKGAQANAPSQAPLQ